MHATAAELDDRVDHLLFFGLEDPLLAASLDEQLQLLGADLVLDHVLDAEQAIDAVRDPRQQPDDRIQDATEDVDEPRQQQRVALRMGERQRFGHELAEDDRDEAEQRGHDDQGDRARVRPERLETLE